jgi:predicted dehydrogenase
MALKVVLVGCGKAADMHVSAIQKLKKARIVAVCDLELVMAEQLAARHSIANCYRDFSKMLSEQGPDVVHIATPPQTHRALAIQAADAGCHLFVEKPLALDSREAAQLIAHAERRSKKLTIGYTYYFSPVARMLRRLVSDGVLGEAVHLESFLGYDLKGPFGSTVLPDRSHWVHSLPGRFIQNLADHLLNKVTEFMPDENPVLQVQSWLNQDRPAQPDCDFPDELRVLLKGNKQSAYVTFSAHCRPVRHFFNFYGTKNTAYLDFESGTITLASESTLPGVLGRLASPFAQGFRHIREGGRNVLRFARSDFHYFAGFHYLLAQFYDSIINSSPVPIAYREILRVATLTDEVVRQLQ